MCRDCFITGVLWCQQQESQYDNSYFYSVVMQQSEEGFEVEDDELMDYNYTPHQYHSSSPSKAATRKRTSPSRLKAKPRVAPAFINQALEDMRNPQTLTNNKRPNKGVISCESCVFDSSFEGGNLQYVQQISKQEFALYLKPDTNTLAHFQWFFFKVTCHQRADLRFTIKNLSKPNMLYKKNLKPFVKGRGKVSYSQLNGSVIYQRNEDDTTGKLYELSWGYYFDRSGEEASFCSQPPYMPQRINNLLPHLPFQKIVIGHSVMGQKITALVANEDKKCRGVVVAMARQHPGQAVGSWMMEGFMRAMQQHNKDIYWIVVPMINPDGVVQGNTRTGLLGYDFNRHWYMHEDSQRAHIFPQILAIVRFMKRKRRFMNKKIKLFLDFHGHSSKPNVFAYGPPHAKDSFFGQASHIFPCLLSEANPNFQTNQCSFQLQPHKLNCARAAFLNRYGFPLSYTVESSFGIYGAKNVGEDAFLKVGSDICRVTAQFMHQLYDDKSKKKEEPTMSKVIEIESKVNTVVSQQAQTVGEAYDSDSSDEENLPAKVQFEEKIIEEMKKTEELSADRQKQRGERIKTEPAAPISLSLPKQIKRPLPIKRRRHDYSNRLKTEQVTNFTSKKQETTNFLPPIAPSRPSFSRLDNPRVTEQTQLQGLTLEEIKVRLHDMKNSRLGRRILLFNSGRQR